MTLVDLLEAQGIDLSEKVGPKAAKRLRHVCEPHCGQLFVPHGYLGVHGVLDSGVSPAVQIRTDTRAGIAPHPLNPRQMTMVAIQPLDAPTIPPAWISVAHLAHRDCIECTHVWLERAQEYDVARNAADTAMPDTTTHWTLFYELPTEEGTAVALIHIGDMPRPSSQ